jgi:hypothetical protein
MTKKDARQERQLQRLGTRKPQCKMCGESDPAALTRRPPNILCYECQAKKAKKLGRSSIEQHHPAGRNNDSFTVPIPANDHRILSDHQIDWPLETLRNPNASPLRAAAATLRG